MLYRNSSNSGLRKQCYRENIYRKKSQFFYIVDTCGQENINREILLRIFVFVKKINPSGR